MRTQIIKLPPRNDNDWRWELYKAAATASGLITDVQIKPVVKVSKAA